MAANTSSREHALQHEVLVSPISDRMDQSPVPSAETKSKIWEPTITHVPSWPEEAKMLRERTWISCLYRVGDVLLVLLPVYFILLGVAVVTLHQKPTRDNSFGGKVESAINLGPTVFPIMFAAVCGRSMKMIARFLSERGSKLSTLELLMASQSVWGTVESQLLMQRFTVVGAHLLFLWALSPLGGQASLRLMSRTNEQDSSSAKIRYLTTGPAGTLWGIGTTYSGNGKFADASALYMAALLAPQATKTGPQDTWGNVKIPSLGALNASNTDSDGWVTVPTDIPTPETYSSLVGLPIVGLPSVDKSNFSIEASYLLVSCGEFEQSPFPGLNGSTNRSPTDWNKLERLVPGRVWTKKGPGSVRDPFSPDNQSTSFFIDTDMDSMQFGNEDGHETLLGRFDGFVGNVNKSRVSDEELKRKRGLIFASLYATTPDLSLFGLNIIKCSLSQEHVEAFVRCQKENCRTDKIRKSLSDNRPEAFTGLDHSLIMQNYVREFAKATLVRQGSSSTERFMADSSIFPVIQQVGYVKQDVAYVNLSTVSPEDFSRRFSLLLNTYYQLSIQPTGYLGSLTGNLSAYGPDTVPATDINVYLPSNLSATNHSFFDWYYTFNNGIQDITSPFIGATASADLIVLKEIFACNFAWLALLLAASSIILLTGGVALSLKRQTFGPEVFGFVSSMTYENPYVKIPAGGTTMDAMERARCLKDVDVYVGDVRGNEDIGHIAFAAGVPLRKLERGRYYS